MATKINISEVLRATFIRWKQWRRNEFESGGHRSWAKVGGTDLARSAGKMFLVVPLHFLALIAQLVVLVSAFVMVSI